MREAHPWKQLDPMAVTVVGTRTEERAVQSTNTAMPNVTTVVSISTASMKKLDLNAALLM